MRRTGFFRVIGLVAVAGLAACQQGASGPAGAGPSGPAGATSVVAAGLPAGGGCAAEIARFDAVLKSDADTGNVNRSVYDRAAPELARAQAACAACRDGEARALLAATKSRFGYP